MTSHLEQKSREQMLAGLERLRMAILAESFSPWVTGAEAKAILTDAFEVLGAERVAKGLLATGHEWHNCFLAVAYETDFVKACVALGEPHTYCAVAHVSGLPYRHIGVLVCQYDRCTDEFRRLAGEWLEATSSSRHMPETIPCAPPRVAIGARLTISSPRWSP